MFNELKDYLGERITLSGCANIVESGAIALNEHNALFSTLFSGHLLQRRSKYLAME